MIMKKHNRAETTMFTVSIDSTTNIVLVFDRMTVRPGKWEMNSFDQDKYHEYRRSSASGISRIVEDQAVPAELFHSEVTRRSNHVLLFPVATIQC